MTATVRTRHAPAAVIGHDEVAGSATVDVVDPFSDSVIGTTGIAEPGIVAQAVDAAADAFPGWSATPAADRAAVLRRAADLIENHASLAATVSGEMGMPISLAGVTQQSMPASVLREFACSLETFAFTEQIDGARLHRVAAGVVGAITPWNMPVHQIIAKVGAALAAGCTVVLKPSEATPFDALLVRECLLAAGLPAGALAVVNGTGESTGAALASNPGVAHVSFTGSVRAGRSVAANAAASLRRATLELGGKSPAVVLADADLDAVLPRVLASGLVNSGQACNATTRLVLPASRATEAESIMAEAISAFRLGDPADPSTTHGPLASRTHTAKVLAHIEAARADGGRIVAGSGENPTLGRSRCFVTPVVFADLTADARAVREEIFGPVLVTQYYDDLADAIAIANDSDYGLSAEVWSARTESAVEVADHLDVGQVKINGVRTRERPAVPFGGTKNSGYGRELGAVGMAEFTEIKAVMS